MSGLKEEPGSFFVFYLFVYCTVRDSLRYTAGRATDAHSGMQTICTTAFFRFIGSIFSTFQGASKISGLSFSIIVTSALPRHVFPSFALTRCAFSPVITPIATVRSSCRPVVQTLLILLSRSGLHYPDTFDGLLSRRKGIVSRLLASPLQHPWFAWIRWINPMYYAFEALMGNECKCSCHSSSAPDVPSSSIIPLLVLSFGSNVPVHPNPARSLRPTVRSGRQSRMCNGGCCIWRDYT
jgi:hypothetical protein